MIQIKESSASLHISGVCSVEGCNGISPDVIVYSVKRAKDREKFNRWCEILKLPNLKSTIYACQRHFPAGAPTKNHPDPNPLLFNPIPNMMMDADNGGWTHQENLPMFNQSILDSDGKHLPSAVLPPAGSFFKLSPNVTLIDLKKIKHKTDLKKPFRIEEVTVMIDDKDSVKVVDYGPKESDVSSFNSNKLKSYQKTKKSFSQSYDNENFMNDINATTFEQCDDPLLGNVLENMRQLHVDCNAVILDSSKKYSIYAHRMILIARSPYFFRQIFLKKGSSKKWFSFCKFSLPIEVDYSILDATISYIYTGSTSYLLDKNPADIRQLLTLFEMKEALKNFEGELSEQIKTVSIKTESKTDDRSVMMFNCLDDSKVLLNDGEKRKRRKIVEVEQSADDYLGKCKVSVQKLVDYNLTPFLVKIEELFDPEGTVLQIAQSSQHIITLWHENILLTKLFDQNDLRSFFSDVMNEILEKNAASLLDLSSLRLKFQNMNNVQHGNYVVEALCAQTGNRFIDDSYNKSGQGMEEPMPVETVTVEGMQILNYQQMYPKYVHMISMYRFNIFMKRKGIRTDETVKDSLIPALLHGDSMSVDTTQTVAIEDLVNTMTDEELLSNINLPSLAKPCFQQVNSDLRRRITADLELYVTPAYHEQLVLHILVDQIVDKNILSISMGVFLAKGCNFCRKKECKIEDLSMAMTADNPVCPDRLCIKQNLQCHVCNKQMATSKSLTRHKYSVHDIETSDSSGLFICSHCGETFCKKWRLNIHEREHEDRKIELPCRYCKKKIKGATALKKHISMVHEAKPQYSCDYCSKFFKRRETLSVHRRIHTGEKPFKCNQCDYASETKGNLKAHTSRKHNFQVLTDNKPVEEINDSHIISEEGNSIEDPTHVIGEVQHPSEEQVMAATIVHPLSDGSFILASGNSPSSLVP